MVYYVYYYELFKVYGQVRVSKAQVSQGMSWKGRLQDKMFPSFLPNEEGWKGERVEGRKVVEKYWEWKKC